jgi:hypothetical protein
MYKILVEIEAVAGTRQTPFRKIVDAEGELQPTVG